MEIYFFGGVLLGYVMAVIVCYFEYRNRVDDFIFEIEKYKDTISELKQKYTPQRDILTGKFKSKK